MTPSPETQSAAQRSRTMWIVALAAMALLLVIAVVAVAAFAGLDLLRPPERDAGAGANSPSIVAPAPTLIRPEIHEPPSEWDDRVG